MDAQLIALAGPLQGQGFHLEGRGWTIGRHASNRLVVRQISISRHHCRLELADDHYRLRDLDSSHGTFVNSRAIHECQLESGDVITLGESQFLFFTEAAPEAGQAGPDVAGGSQVRPIEEASTALSLRPEEVAPARAGEDLLGDSAQMRKLRSLIARIARVDSTVLIGGESGSGKELVARLLHSGSPRCAKPLVTVNCATLSETLLESELFGHEKGAFTGAVQRRLGQFERADGGTLFLDEVGELPITLQAKLLRALQEREFERLGAQRTVKVDVRVIAATNRDLEAEVTRRRFRDDLFYRLNVIALVVPPLRDRRGDVPLLATHFLFQNARRLKRPSMALSHEARAALVAYTWPGNVRELANAIERAVVLAQEPIVRPEDLPEAVLECQPRNPAASNFHEAINACKRDLILKAMWATRGNVTHAAKRLGLSVNYLHRLIRNLGLRAELDRQKPYPKR